MLEIFETRESYVSKVFDISYKKGHYNTALELVIKYRMHSSNVSSKKMRKVIKWKMNQYSDAQRDSIIQSAYDSIL
jgi:hypothetical protein